MFNISTVVFDWHSPPFIVQTLRYGTPQVQVVFIAFPRQQWLRRRASMLRLWPAYIARLVSAEMSVTIIFGHFASCLNITSFK